MHKGKRMFRYDFIYVILKIYWYYKYLSFQEVENLNCVTKDRVQQEFIRNKQYGPTVFSAKKALFSIEFNKKALKISKDIKVNKGVKKILDIITIIKG